MTNTRSPIPDKARSSLFLLWHRVVQRMPSSGYAFLIATILVLALLGSFKFTAPINLLLEGEIAPTDIVAEQSFLFEDKAATAQRKNIIRLSQPLICDFLPAPIELFYQEIRQTLIDINTAITDEEKRLLLIRLSEEFGEPVSLESLDALADSKTQEIFQSKILGTIELYLREGVLPEIRMVLPYKDGGLIIRSVDSGEERIYPDIYAVPDLKSLEVSISRSIREQRVSGHAKRLFTHIILHYLRPSLAPNFEVTNARIEQLEQRSEPIMVLVQQGEIIIRQGQKVSKEQQIKMQAVLTEQKQRFNPTRFIGISLCALLLSLSFFTPSAKTKTIPLQNRDLVVVSSLLILFSLFSLLFLFLGTKIASTSTTLAPENLAYAVPVAAAAGLLAMIFPLRNHIIGIVLIAFFCTVMSDGSLGLFLYYTLGGALSSLFILRSNSRREMLVSFFPLTGGLIVLWLAATCLDGGLASRFQTEIFAVATSTFLSLCLTFVLAPLAELAFGYTTRFQLVELLNLDQPILRDLMLKAPGTYHHSLIVSNLVESAAKAVGANSLLCKVAALYHDIGKISKAEYFIENQFQINNPHDRLTPSMSALILISHTKTGAELAQKQKLGPEITDIIRQHHGNGLIRFFYHKALQQNDALPPNIEDFCYPGSRPQTKEAGIVMLADIVEASCRTLNYPSSSRLQGHLESVLKNIYADGQLDETGLTFRDLAVIADCFLKVLRGIFHHRVVYPDAMEKDSAKNANTPKNTNASANSNGQASQAT